jgi:hypothetical protein
MNPFCFMTTSEPAGASRATGPAGRPEAIAGRLFVLDLSANCVLAMNADGTDKKILAAECRHPDGVAVDPIAGHVYWTNMGVPSQNDGSIERVDIDGRNRRTIVPRGATFTPKQLHIDLDGKRLYWCDREGMRVMRANLDGTRIETLVEAGSGDTDRRDQTKWCVGITIDPDAGHVYWTQKGPDNGGKGRLLRARLDMPFGESPALRTDVELIFDVLPEPIDLELDRRRRMIYWTDRGDPPRGNTVSRASIDAPPGQARAEIVFTHLMEGIGLALDVPGDRMFVTDLGGTVYTARLDGRERRELLVAQGNLAGIAYVDASTKER